MAGVADGRNGPAAIRRCPAHGGYRGNRRGSDGPRRGRGRGDRARGCTRWRGRRGGPRWRCRACSGRRPQRGRRHRQGRLGSHGGSRYAPPQEKSREIAQGLAQDITGPIKEALKSGEFSWETFAGAISRIAQNLATRLIELAFKPIETALLNAFMGGGGGGGYPRQPVRLCQRWGLRRRCRTDRLRAGWRGEPANGVPLRQGCGADGRGRARGDPAPAARQGRQAWGGNERGGSAAAPAAQMSTRIINVLDPSVVGDYLATSSGERAILNVIRRNRGSLNA